ncbi:hypothetical protein AGMMS50229_11150 [Campylobacterota bacterium]|nr:hypothetical protein AGMMS50229_11150 [Campylobacterota bacterium]
MKHVNRYVNENQVQTRDKNADRQIGDKLHRIYFYDCPPIAKCHHNPISKRAIDFAKSDESVFRLSLHHKLKKMRKVALRLGTLSEGDWVIRPSATTELLKGKRTYDSLTEYDVALDIRQKGVDMRIGIDIASLAYKQQVKQIVLIAGDADFIPAAKLARREGIDFVLDSMWKAIPEELHEHIDGLWSTFRRPNESSDPQY